MVDDLSRHIGGKCEIDDSTHRRTRQILDTNQALQLVCIEPNANCARRASEELNGQPRVAIRKVHLEECVPTDLQAERFDTIVCVNVLEHIADDVQALTLFREVVAGTNGKVLIFVPAVQRIYGPHDAALGHHRRYSRRSLTAAFTAAGLVTESIRYTNPIGLLGWMYNLYVSGNTEHTSGQVRLFDRLVAPWALPLERVVTPPIGLSLFAVGRARTAR